VAVAMARRNVWPVAFTGSALQNAFSRRWASRERELLQSSSPRSRIASSDQPLARFPHLRGTHTPVSGSVFCDTSGAMVRVDESRSFAASAARIAAGTVVFVVEESLRCYKERPWNMRIFAFWRLSQGTGA
jgi:hypothetical protein